MPTVVVTGVAGFVGSHVAEECIAQGHTVHGIDDLSGGDLRNVPEGTSFHQGDIRDAAFINSVFQQAGTVDYVYHLAAYAAENLSHWIRRHVYEVNVLGTMNLVNASVQSGVKVFVFTSSIAVYGHGPGDGTPFHEDTTTPKPEDPYGVGKYAVEMDLRCASQTFGMKYIVFRLHNVYGPRQALVDRYRNVVGIFMKCALEHRAFPVYGDGEQTRAFTYVEDIRKVMVAAPECSNAWNRVFNLGSDVTTSINELGTTLRDVWGEVTDGQKCVHDNEYLTARHEVVHASCNHDKARQVFAQYLSVPTPLKDGLAQTAKWVWAKRDILLGHKPKAPPFGSLEIDVVETPFPKDKVL